MSTGHKNRGVWVRYSKTKKDGTKPTLTPSKAVEALSESSENYRRLYEKRHSQMITLASMSAVLKAVAHRVTHGPLTQEGLDRLAPPACLIGSSTEADALYEYIRQTLIDLRPILSNLYRDNMELAEELESVHISVSKAEPQPLTIPDSSNVPILTIRDLDKLLEEEDSE